MITQIETNIQQTSKRDSSLCNPDRWVDEHGDYLYRYALMRLRNKNQAEEIVQETFLAAFQGRKNFSGNSSERTWLVGILKHKVIDHFRRSSKEVALEDTNFAANDSEETFRTSGEWIGHWNDTSAPGDWGLNPIRALEQKEFRDALERCLASLPERLAQVFILREVDEMTTSEICKLLGITESNLWVMLHRSRMQLRRLLELQYFRRQMK